MKKTERLSDTFATLTYRDRRRSLERRSETHSLTLRSLVRNTLGSLPPQRFSLIAAYSRVRSEIWA